MQPAPPQNPAKKGLSTVAIVLIIVGVLALFVIAGIGIMAALGVYGARKYLQEAKRAEGRMNVTMLAQGMVACAAHPGAHGAGALPPSSHKVPASLSDVSNKKYQSTATEWTGDPAYACAHFELTTPQYFQYEWQLLTPTSGTARAVADLDGDGKIDATVESQVSCSAPGTCSAGVVTVK